MINRDLRIVIDTNRRIQVPSATNKKILVKILVVIKKSIINNTIRCLN